MYTMSIDKEQQRFLVTWGKTIDGNGLIGYQKKISSEPSVHGFDELIDFRSLRDIDINREALEIVAHLAASMDAINNGSRLAIVASRPLPFGLARMYQIIREIEKGGTRDMMVFESIDDASAWLDETH